MTNSYGRHSDDFYVNMNLNTEMDLPTNRETVLHFFEQVQKKYPSMKNFYNRERGELVLEEDKDQGDYRWVSVEGRRICAGYVNPPSLQDVMEQHFMLADLIPYTLSVSTLDCESINLMFGYDFNYRGNQNALVAEALGVIPAFEKLSEAEGIVPICYEPTFQFSLDEDCRTQCRLNIETRTTAYHIRTGEYPEDQLSVYLTARRYGSLQEGETYLSVLKKLQTICEDLINQYVIENILVPLQQTIALK